MTTQSAITAVDEAAKRAAAIAEASVTKMASLLDRYLTEDDGSKLLEIRTEAEGTDPMQPLESLAFSAGLITGLKNPAKRMAAARTKQSKAAQEVERLKEEAARAREKYAADIRAANERADQLRDELADLQVDADRWKTLTTDEVAAGCAEFSNPILRSWAKSRGII